MASGTNRDNECLQLRNKEIKERVKQHNWMQQKQRRRETMWLKRTEKKTWRQKQKGWFSTSIPFPSTPLCPHLIVVKANMFLTHPEPWSCTTVSRHKVLTTWPEIASHTFSKLHSLAKQRIKKRWFWSLWLIYTFFKGVAASRCFSVSY